MWKIGIIRISCILHDNMSTTRKEHWLSWYIALVVVLILQIVLYYFFTRHWK
jgi:hypothetical protein